MCRSGWSTTAAATTGPARHPRPTSSHPATWTNPTRRRAFSSVRVAGTRVIARQTSDFTLHALHFTLYSSRLRLPRRPAFFHAGRLALQIAEVVELRAPHFRGPRDLDLLNRRRVQRKNALHALPERDLSDRERRPRAPAMDADDDALEDLNAFLVAFADFHVNLDGVAGLHRRPLGQL